MERGNVSTISRWTMCFCFFGIFQFVASTPSWAASFDCAKATTKVEKMICQDAELSKLDEEMTQMYQRARASIPNKLPGDRLGGHDWLKRQQKAWLKLERNACATAECLIQAYELRMIELALAVQPEPKAKARRHPDIWGAELPTDGTGRAEEAQIFEDRRGRIQIVYAFDTATQRVYRAYSFFDKAILAEWRSERGESNELRARRAEIDRRRKAYQKEQTVDMLVDERVQLAYTRGYFQGKGEPLLLTSMRKLPRSLHVGNPPCSYQIHSDLSRDGALQFEWEHRFVLIRIYPEPQPMDPDLVENNSSCSELANNYRLRGRNVNVIAANLRDGTILVKDKGYPLVIRLRTDLESPYLRERDDLFLVSHKDMMRWNEEAQDIVNLDRLVIEKLTGK